MSIGQFLVRHVYEKEMRRSDTVTFWRAFFLKYVLLRIYTLNSKLEFELYKSSDSQSLEYTCEYLLQFLVQLRDINIILDAAWWHYYSFCIKKVLSYTLSAVSRGRFFPPLRTLHRWRGALKAGREQRTRFNVCLWYATLCIRAILNTPAICITRELFSSLILHNTFAKSSYFEHRFFIFASSFSDLQKKWVMKKPSESLKTPYRCGSDIWVVARLCCRSQYDARRIVVASIRVALWRRYTYHKTGYRYQSDTYRYNRVTMYKDLNSNN